MFLLENFATERLFVADIVQVTPVGNNGQEETKKPISFFQPNHNAAIHLFNILSNVTFNQFFAIIAIGAISIHA